MARDLDNLEHPLIAESRSMILLRRMVERVAEGDAKVLITGESGVGKDLVARLIHLRSKRRGRPFVAVNCGAFAESLLETELFGHARGSFTGAYRDKIGKLQQADHGTIFFDEVGEMSLRMQAALLRFLESGEIQAVGTDTALRRVDVRVVAATNRNLAALVAQGAFRGDLLYRLKVIQIQVPPLRERREDVRPLIQHTLARIGRGVSFSAEALEALERYHWPGNVRELQNVIEQMSWQSGADVVCAEDLPEEFQREAAISAPRARDRRRQIADDLFEGLLARRYRFWEDVRRRFLDREIAKRDLHQLICRGLSSTHGSYRAVLSLFGMPASDYKRFLNFLSAHDCMVDFHPYRNGQAGTPSSVVGVAARGQAADDPVPDSAADTASSAS
jgi:transcriptional regulator with PAS, ATPase and Fis domain